MTVRILEEYRLPTPKHQPSNEQVMAQVRRTLERIVIRGGSIPVGEAETALELVRELGNA